MSFKKLPVFILLLACLYLPTCSNDVSISDTEDVYVYLLIGQSNLAGKPVLKQGIPKGYSKTLKSKIWIPSRFLKSGHWERFRYNKNAFGPEVSFMALMDILKPGKVFVFKNGVGGTRLRINPNPDRMDWSVDSSGELFDRTINLHLIPGLSVIPGNVKMKGVIWIQGEADCNLNTERGDYFNITPEEIYQTRIKDTNNLFNKLKSEIEKLGYATEELKFHIMEQGPGASVKSRQFYNEIVRADRYVSNQRKDTQVYSSHGLQVHKDSIHINVNGQIENGKRNFEYFKEFIK